MPGRQSRRTVLTAITALPLTDALSAAAGTTAHPSDPGAAASRYSRASVSPEYYPVVITGSLLAVLPLILAFVLLQRFWRSGLTAGAVK